VVKAMPRWEGDEPTEPRVDDRVLEVLAESSGRIAFSGLRRVLQVHPESLTRALRRLERDGSIRRAGGSYELSAPITRGREGSPPVTVRTVASVELPPGGSREEIFGRLSGRWFGRLRWVGIFDHPGDPWLVWSVEGSAAHVMLSTRAGRLRVLAEGSPKVTEGAVDDAAYELLTHAVSRLRELPRREGPAVAFLASSPDRPTYQPN
jgi:DNA-binding Lrp family transcriptional regulator